MAYFALYGVILSYSFWKLRNEVIHNKLKLDLTLFFLKHSMLKEESMECQDTLQLVGDVPHT